MKIILKYQVAMLPIKHALDVFFVSWLTRYPKLFAVWQYPNLKNRENLHEKCENLWKFNKAKEEFHLSNGLSFVCE